MGPDKVNRQKSFWLRPMREEDIPQVLDIDHEAFSTQWPPASYASFKQELRNRIAHYIVLCTNRPVSGEDTTDSSHNRWQTILKRLVGGTVSSSAVLAMPQRETILGFAGVWKIYDEAHIISIAVRQAYRRRGLGELLLQAAIHLAYLLEAKVVTLEVRVSNRAAQELYVKYGFRSAGIRHHYYTDNNEDALIMTTEPIDSETFRANYQRLRQVHAQRWPEIYQ